MTAFDVCTLHVPFMPHWLPLHLRYQSLQRSYTQKTNKQIWVAVIEPVNVHTSYTITQPSCMLLTHMLNIQRLTVFFTNVCLYYTVPGRKRARVRSMIKWRVTNTMRLTITLFFRTWQWSISPTQQKECRSFCQWQDTCKLGEHRPCAPNCSSWTRWRCSLSLYSFLKVNVSYFK